MSPSTKMACTQRSTQVRYFQADSSLCVSIEVACFWPSKTKYLLKKRSCFVDARGDFHEITVPAEKT